MPMRFGVLLMVIALLLPRPGVAQEANPLQKTDLIRLLTGTTYTKAEVASIIRRNCLTFSPTARDRSDFRALGADSRILAALEECERRSGTPTLSLPRRSITTAVGQRVTIAVQVRRGQLPEPGVRLVLRGSGAIPGGAGSDAVATTGTDGRASFRLSAGTAAGSYTLRVVGDPVAVQGASVVRLTTVPGPPRLATFTPERIVIGSEAQHSLRIQLRDSFGNPVAGRAVEIRGGRPDAPALASGSTDRRGEIEFSLSAESLRREERISIVAGDRSVGEVPVEFDQPGEEGTGFIAGTDQRGEAGERLPAPLVLQLRAPTGAPLKGRSVRFRATNGRVSPELADTDPEGKVEVRVTLGEAGRRTEIVASIGTIERRVSFEPTIGGLTLGEYNTALADAARLVALGDHGGAREIYARLLAADPLNVDALVGYGRALEGAGEPALAELRFRAALQEAPGRRDALLGLARISLAEGRAEEGASWFEAVVRQDPDNAAAWVGLGDARAAAGDAEGARAAFERALALDPSLEEVQRRLTEPGGVPLLAEIEVWGGDTFDNGRDAGPRTMEAHIWPMPRLELWGGFDNALNLRHPYLIRGPDDIEESYGGFTGSWGPTDRLRTQGMFARRTHPPDGTIQTIWLLEQGIHLRDDVFWMLGGLLGHWYDRDDWVVFTGLELVPAPGLRIDPTLSYGDHAGSNIVDTGRAAERELRFMIEAEFESPDGWGIAPRLAAGSVSSADDEDFEGGLFEGQFRVWARFIRTNRIELLVRTQSSPGSETFTTVALGLRLGLERRSR